jgi:hypothetical protein
VNNETTTTTDNQPVDFEPDHPAELVQQPPQERGPRTSLVKPLNQAPEGIERVALMKMSPEIGELMGALAEAQGKFGTIERTLNARIKSAKADYEYDYAPLDEVLQAVRPHLSAAGIAITQIPYARQGSVLVRTMLAHKSGQFMFSDLLVQSEGSDARSVGSAITYGRRYALMAILGVAPEYDDDGAAATATPPAPPRSAPRQRQEQSPAEGDIKSPIGKIKSLEVASEERALVRLSTGYVAAAKTAELVQALRGFKAVDATIELRASPSSDPKKYAPIIDEILLKKNTSATAETK